MNTKEILEKMLSVGEKYLKADKIRKDTTNAQKIDLRYASKYNLMADEIKEKTKAEWDNLRKSLDDNLLIYISSKPNKKSIENIKYLLDTANY